MANYFGIILNHYCLKDVHVTGFAAEACGIKRLHHPGFSTGPGTRTFDKQKDILRHYVDSNLKSLFANILNNME